MFARLCNPASARRFKLRQDVVAKRRHSWSSLVPAAQADVAVGYAQELAPQRRSQSADSSSDPSSPASSEDNEESPKDVTFHLNGPAQCLDLLETCWSLERARLRHEPTHPSQGHLYLSEPEYESAAALERHPEPGMGQRASSTSSLQVKTPANATSGRVSLTWALLKRPAIQPSSVLLTASPCSAANHPRSNRSRVRESKEIRLPQQPAPQVPRHRGQQNVRPESGAKRFGYDIHDVDEFLSKASLQSPANIPVVLSSPSVLYQPGARRGRSGHGSWRQSELSLPLGMVVNAVFRSHAWLYVHTPHGEAGYVRYRSCLPLGILPQPPASSAPGTPAPGAWDMHTDTFPPPPPPSRSRARRGTTSVCDTRHRRTNKTDTEKLRDTVSEGGRSTSRHRHRRHHRVLRPEEAVDQLFLASQRAESVLSKYPVTPKVYCHQTSSVAHRTSIETLLKDAETSARRYREETCAQSLLDTVSVKDSVSQCGVAPSRLHHKQKSESKSLPPSACVTPSVLDRDMELRRKLINRHKLEQLKLFMNTQQSYDIKAPNCNNNNPNNKLPTYRTVAQQTDFAAESSQVIKDAASEVYCKSDFDEPPWSSLSSHSEIVGKDKRNNSNTKTETLLLIRSDYNSRGRNTLSVSKGDVVVLVSGRLKDWFWVRRGDGCEGFIPSVVAGHGFL